MRTLKFAPTAAENHGVFSFTKIIRSHLLNFELQLELRSQILTLKAPPPRNFSKHEDGTSDMILELRSSAAHL